MVGILGAILAVPYLALAIVAFIIFLIIALLSIVLPAFQGFLWAIVFIAIGSFILMKYNKIFLIKNKLPLGGVFVLIGLGFAVFSVLDVSGIQFLSAIAGSPSPSSFASDIGVGNITEGIAPLSIITLGIMFVFMILAIVGINMVTKNKVVKV
jgi:hypothetical protein